MLDEKDIELLREMFGGYENAVSERLRNFQVDICGQLEGINAQLEKIGSDLDGMIRDLENIHVTARENKVMLKRICDRIERNIDEEITPEWIIDTVAEYFDIPVKDICGPESEFEQPRFIAMYLCRMMTNLPLGSIGEMLGGYDRSATMHGISKIEEEREKNEEIRKTISALENKIREEKYIS